MGDTMDIVSLIIQLVAGVVGGNVAGKASPKFNMGGAGNSITGAIGGLVLGQILERVTGGAMPAADAAATTQGLDIASILTSLIGGGAGGAVLSGIVGALKNR